MFSLFILTNLVSLDLEISFWVCETYKQQLFHIWHHAFERLRNVSSCLSNTLNTHRTRKIALICCQKESTTPFCYFFFHEWSRKPWIETFNCMSMMFIVKCILLHASVSHFFTLFGLLNGRHRRSLGKVRLRSNKWRFLWVVHTFVIHWLNKQAFSVKWYEWH